MPAKMQVDLLRVLQDGHVTAVGSSEPVEVDVRVISASNKSLRELVEQGRFREDLYYRLNVVDLRIPPLRERVADLPLLADHFLRTIANRQGVPPKRLSREALQRLGSHPLPGNVRQLEHLLLNACVMGEGETIEADDLALDDVAANDLVSVARGHDAVAAAASVEAASSAARAQSLDEYKTGEKQRILAALEEHGWNRARAASALGMARRTFYRRLKEHEILE
jgi:two-component system response regulator PilR (NtrC family)